MDQSGNHYLITAGIFATLLIGLVSTNWSLGTESSSSQLFVDMYRKVSDFNLNDLYSLYYFFVTANIAIHFIIGIMLFLLTLFLFSAVVAYTSVNASRSTSYRSVANKLFTTKAYYEQSGRVSQKYFSQGKK